MKEMHGWLCLLAVVLAETVLIDRRASCNVNVRCSLPGKAREELNRQAGGGGVATWMDFWTILAITSDPGQLQAITDQFWKGMSCVHRPSPSP